MKTPAPANKFNDFIDINESFVKRSNEQNSKVNEDIVKAASVGVTNEEISVEDDTEDTEDTSQNKQSDDYPIMDTEPQISDEIHHYGNTYPSK